MGWFSNLFSSSSNINARRKMTISTHDAFSLPTSSPITASHPESSFARLGAHTPDMEPPSSAAYAYPPPTSSPTTYDYVPRQNGKRSSTLPGPPLLPLHNSTPLSPVPPYPPLEQTWARLRNWLSREYPELGDTLNYGILPQDLGEVELALGIPLPQVVRESYLLVDGQEAESSAGCSEGLFFGLTFLPLEDVLDEWRFWREVDDDPSTGGNARLREVMQSIPPGWVRRAYSQRGWIPLVTDKSGNYLGVDLSPDAHGSVGQVIVFGRDFDTKVVLWSGDGPAGWARWLASFVDELENGEGFEVGHGSDGSEGSEDSVGYESYFFDGSGGTKGEGGGDTGAGLRLTGEYRGWNVLEAWADRSAKRWRQAGQLSDPLIAPKPSARGTAKIGLGVIDLTTSSSNTGAEVPIPVVVDADDQDAKTPTAPLTNLSSSTPTGAGPSQPPQPLPVISVSKPPAPCPVHLPSPQDFNSDSPAESRSNSFDQDLERGRQLSIDEVERPLSRSTVAVTNSFDHDLERGQHLPSDEVEHPLSSPSVTVKAQSPTSPTARHSSDVLPIVKEAVLVSLPSSDTAESVESNSTLVADLLQQNDSSEGVQIVPLEPASSPVERKVEADNLLADTTLVPSASDVFDAPSDVSREKEEEMQDPDQTIRLVGGGGTSGIVAEPEPLVDSAQEPDVTDVASIASAASTDVDSASGAAPRPGKSKHEKKKSFSSGLKKIGKLGSGHTKRKTESKDLKAGVP